MVRNTTVPGRKRRTFGRTTEESSAAAEGFTGFCFFKGRALVGVVFFAEFLFFATGREAGEREGVRWGVGVRHWLWWTFVSGFRRDTLSRNPSGACFGTCHEEGKFRR